MPELEDLGMQFTFNKKQISIKEIQCHCKSYQSILEAILETYQIDSTRKGYSSKQIKHQMLKTYTRQYRHYTSHQIPITKSILTYVLKMYGISNPITKEEYRSMLSFLQKTPSRNNSGVSVITVLTSPYPDGQSFSCKHDCFYCPAEPDQPRSYLKKEPAVARANQQGFDATNQMLNRMDTLLMNGHELDKIEIILEGGTFTEYPVPYLERFIRDLVYTVNTYYQQRTHKTNVRSPLSVEEEIEFNKTARIKISGICIETRPDIFFEPDGREWLVRLRKWAITRVQIGVQHLNDTILEEVNRGHDADTASQAIEILKNNCFKVDMHLMPDLPNSTPDMDAWMFQEVYRGRLFQADQIKIYPCQVVPWTKIEKWYKSGKYQPYAETDKEGFIHVIKTAMLECPPWIRLSRVVRDIPNNYIQGGNKRTNLRQIITNELEKEGRLGEIKEIRERECSRHEHSMEILEQGLEMYRERTYETRIGREVFLSCETPDEKALFGFCRLRLPRKYTPSVRSVELDYRDGRVERNMGAVFPELHKMALIRELHVYGSTTRVGTRGTNTQHRGIGTELLRRAEQYAWKEGFHGLAVISGCGVEGYYEKKNYSKIGSFMIKRFAIRPKDIYAILCFVFVLCIVLFETFYEC